MSSSLEPATAFNQGPFGVEECGFDASAALAELDQPRQILVFQTLQDALTASPPRPDATFERVVKAYTTLAHVVLSAANGRLTDAELAGLQHDIEVAGGEIAPGFKSTGDDSLAVFRAKTFGLLDQGYDAAVVAAIAAALNARLKVQAIEEIDDLLRTVAAFFADLSPSTSNAQTLRSFAELDVDRQILVFESVKAGILAQPPRQDATFSALVSAYRAERDVLLSAQQGMLDDACLAHLENSLVSAGGVIEPGIWAHGRSSVASFRAETFRILQQLLPADVLRAALRSLNVGLCESRPSSVFEVFSAAKNFFSPLLNENWDSQTMRSFRALATDRQSLVFETIEISLRENPGLEASIFASAVKAVAQEHFVVESADKGMLTLEMLLDLREAIQLCGGEIAPGIRSEGTGSVAEFCDQCFLALARVMPKSVYAAAMAALNASLKASSISCIEDVKSVVKSFTDPLCGVKPLTRPFVDPARGSGGGSALLGDASEIVTADDAGSLQASVEQGPDLGLIAVAFEGGCPEVGVASDGYGEVVGVEESDLPDEHAGDIIDFEAGSLLPSGAGPEADDHASGSERPEENSDIRTSLQVELERDSPRASPYPIFSLNTPAVAPGPVEASAGSVSVDDHEDGDETFLRS